MISVLAFGVVVLVVFAVGTVACWRRKAEFEERFPPISDEEFLARCRPGTDPLIALKVRRVVADSLAAEYERIYPSSRLVEDLGAE